MRGRYLKSIILGAALLAAAGHVTVATAQTFLIFGYTNVWRYNTDCLDGTGWEQAAYDDSAWLSGPGGFTGGETAAGLLPVLTTRTLPAPAAASQTPAGHAMYFRTHFSVASATGLTLIMSNAVDDGAVIYLNGTQLANLRVTTPNVCASFSGGAIGAGTDARLWETNIFDSVALAGILHSGDNVVAVEVHQVNAGSSDMVFAMELRGLNSSPPIISVQPTNTTVTEGQVATLVVVADGSPPLTYQWYIGTPPTGTAVAGATSPSFSVTNTAGSGRAWSVPADSGDYYVIVTGPVAPPKTSAVAHVTVTPDTTAPTFVYAVCEADLRTFTVVTSEPLDNSGGDVTEAFFWTIEAVGPGSDLGFPASITIANGTNLTFVAQADRDPSTTYRIRTLESQHDQAGPPRNTMPADSSVVVDCPTCISVTGAGSGTFTFDRQPFVSQFSSFTWAGGSAAPNDLASLDAAVQLLDASTINVALLPAAGTPPAANNGPAMWASGGHYLLTRPTGTEGEVIMATLCNDSGSTKSGVVISYSLTVDGSPTTVEEVYGQAAYYSTTGGANTWVRIPGSEQTDNTLGTFAKSFTLDLTATPWAAGDKLYILWADDNGSGTPDNANEIDNFSASFPSTTTPVHIAQSPSSVTTNEGSVVRLTVVVDMGSPPIHYQWYKGASPLSDGGNISGATTATLVISNSTSANNGTYFVRVSNDVPSMQDSATATVTITPDLTRPNVVNVSGGTTATTVTITFSKPVSAATAQNTANYSISPSLAISSAVLDPTGMIVTLTTVPRVAGTKYTITIHDIHDTRASSNLLDPNPTVLPLLYEVQMLAFTDVWKYDQSGTDLGTAWRANGFVDTSWASGPGVLGFETTANTLTFLQTIAPPNGTNTVLSLTNAAGVTNITEYFRTTFMNPLADLSGILVVMRAYIDDGAVWYLNGTEAGRYNISNTPTLYSTLADAALTEPTPAPQTTFITRTLTGVVPGLNHFAAEVHQAPLPSSDIDWGAEIFASIGRPTLTITLEGANVRIRWRPAAGALQHTDNMNDAPVWTAQGTGAANGEVGPGEYVVPATQAHRFYSLRP